MNSLTDIIIDKYRAQDEVAKAQNRELSKQFHDIFRKEMSRAILKGKITKLTEEELQERA